MGVLKALVYVHVLGALLFGALIFAILTDRFPPVPEVPDVPVEWFGKGERVAEDTAVRPFTIKVDEKVLTDLKTRIELDVARIVSPLDDVAFEYGFNTDYLRTVADYWLKKYDWRKQEKALNAFPQFKTNIDGLEVHFLRVKPDPKRSKGKKILPMLLVHGWPGSIAEFTKIIPLLTAVSPSDEFAIEVIAPSIPGYGFSSAPAKTGFNTAQAARIFKQLMERLGYKKFYTQGGDWGALITANLAQLYPDSVIGLHLNMLVGNTPAMNLKTLIGGVLSPNLVMEAEDAPHVYPFWKKLAFIFSEMGYFHLQATKPDTVGMSLNSSPLGLAAYILEKFTTWTEPANRFKKDGGLTEKFNMDELLTNVMIYWVSGSITSSMRMYSESGTFTQDSLDFDSIPIGRPAGLVQAPNELAYQPVSLLKHKYTDIVQYSKFTKGGHFLAMEEPKLLSEDFRKFVKKVEEKKSNKSKEEL